MHIHLIVQVVLILSRIDHMVGRNCAQELVSYRKDSGKKNNESLTLKRHATALLIV